MPSRSSCRPSKIEIRQQFRVFNALYFGSRLPEVPVHWRRMSDYGACFDPCAKYPHGLIVLSTMGMPPCGWSGVLLHEMLHLSLNEADVDEYEHGEVAYHGPLFVAECNRIGAALGLPEYDEETAWEWPFEHMLEGVAE